MQRFLRARQADLMLAGVVLCSAWALTRMVAGGLTGAAAVPFVVVAAAGSLVPALVPSRAGVAPLRAFGGVVLVIVASLWTTSLGATTFGLPTAKTWRIVEAHLRSARPALRSFSPPLPATPGILLLGALTVGMVAVLSAILLRSAVSSGRLRPGLALLLPLIVMVVVCGETPSASLAVPLTLFALLAAVALVGAQPRPVSSGRPTRGRAGTVALTAAVMLAGAGSALAVGAGSAGAGGGGGPIPATGLSLTSRLVSLEIHDADLPLFTVESSYPTYWQVAVLDDLRDGVWVAAHSQSAAPEPGGPAPRTFTSEVHIRDFSSRLLPVPPGTVAVGGGVQARLTSEGAEASRLTRAGERYTVTAAVPSTDPAAAVGGQEGEAPASPSLAIDLALPPIPSSVKFLAGLVTLGEQSPLGKAEALVNWFRSGKFRYSLRAPEPKGGTNAIVDFLTRTRAGNCEEFAGAFAVLARSVGLPTRLVVGFTTGKRSARDRVTVSGEDAHAWPEVYLGPPAGWVSFEPTPQLLTGELAPEGVIGPTGITRTVVPPPGGTPTTSVTTVPPTTNPTTTSVTPTTATSTTRSTSGTHRHTGRRSPGGTWWVWVAAGAALVLAGAGGRRLADRRLRRAGQDPARMVQSTVLLIDRGLRRAGRGRPPWVPLTVHVAALRRLVDIVPPGATMDDAPPVVDQLRAALREAAAAADFAERAKFGPGPIDGAAAAVALAEAGRAGRCLSTRPVRRLLDGAHDDALSDPMGESLMLTATSKEVAKWPKS